MIFKGAPYTVAHVLGSMQRKLDECPANRKKSMGLNNMFALFS